MTAPRSTTEVRHRRDIDGLRALAIVPVLLFHARIGGFSGGFVGVDVFLVISGFLITGLLTNDIARSRFSIAAFYERRARRILPALFVVLAASAVAAHVLLLPGELQEYGESLLATVVFSSNIYFWSRAGYFDRPAETKPLLHTWSLAVEEQFYIIYPLFLFLVSRYWRRHVPAAIAFVLSLSFALNVWGTATHRVANFYLAPGRGWELLVGAVLATGVIPQSRHRILDTALGFLGLGMILYSVAVFSPATAFPGTSALVPVIGTALIIYSGADGDTVVARALAWRPLVFIGLISYSLYLWHWVLLVFGRYYVVHALTVVQTATLLATAFLLASLSWRFVESPFRGRNGFGTRRWIFTSALTASFAIGVYGVIARVGQGLPGRFDAATRTIVFGWRDSWSRRDACNTHICFVGTESQSPSFILWGDSHAGALAPVVEEIAKERRLRGIVAFGNACVPILRLRRYDLDRADCAAFEDSVMALVDAMHIPTVVLHARWGQLTEGIGLDPLAAPALLTPSRRVSDNPAELDTLLRTTLAELQRRDVRIVIVASVPEVAYNVPATLGRTRRTGKALEISPRAADFMTRQTRAFAILRRAASDFGATLVFPHERLCDATSCAVARDGHSLYTDDTHLSVHGAEQLKPLIERALGLTSPPDIATSGAR